MRFAMFVFNHAVNIVKTTEGSRTTEQFEMRNYSVILGKLEFQRDMHIVALNENSATWLDLMRREEYLGTRHDFKAAVFVSVV
jgi:hypothetical protein